MALTKHELHKRIWAKQPLALGVMTPQDFTWFFEVGVIEEMPAGKVLIEEGLHVNELFIVLRGNFRVSVRARQDLEIAVLGPGEVIGEVSLVDYRAPSATVTAIEDQSLILRLSREQLEAQCSRDTEFGVRFYHTLAIYLADRIRNFPNMRNEAPVRSTPVERQSNEEPPALPQSVPGQKREQRLRP